MLEKIKDHEKQFSTLSTALVCTAAMLVITFWGYEEHVPAVVIGALRKVALIVATLMWVYASFMRGLLKKTGFVIFTALYFTLPMLISSLADRVDDAKEYSLDVYVIGEYCKLLVETPLRSIPVLRDMQTVTGAVIFSSAMIVIFVLGMFIGSKSGAETVPDDDDYSHLESSDDL